MQKIALSIPDLAPLVINAALQCMHAFGKKRQPDWSKPAAYVVLGTVEITLQEPDRLTHTPYHQLYVWKDRKRVLYATWAQSSSGPYKALIFRRGSWIDEILGAADLAT